MEFIDEILKRKELVYAIDYCIENNILAEFLQKNRDEVMVMLCAEYSFEDFKADTEMLIQEQAEQIAEKDNQIAEQKEYITELEPHMVLQFINRYTFYFLKLSQLLIISQEQIAPHYTCCC